MGAPRDLTLHGTLCRCDCPIPRSGRWIAFRVYRPGSFRLLLFCCVPFGGRGLFSAFRRMFGRTPWSQEVVFQYETPPISSNPENQPVTGVDGVRICFSAISLQPLVRPYFPSPAVLSRSVPSIPRTKVYTHPPHVPPSSTQQESPPQPYKPLPPLLTPAGLFRQTLS